MPEIDLEPGNYSERKPKGWRWTLPWSHPVSARTPFVGMLVAFGFLAYFFSRASEITDPVTAIGVGIVFGFPAGGFFFMAFRP